MFKYNINNIIFASSMPVPIPLFPDAPCSELQGLLSGQLSDSQISASSFRDLIWAPSTARLVASRSGWFPAPPQALAGEEWLQVDLGTVKMVSGLITQGARGGDGGTSSENRAFVRKYRLAYSMNGKDWNFVMDSKTSMPKVTACINFQHRRI